MSSDKNALILKSLGEVIFRLRKEKKMTQEELGKMTGTSQMTVKRLESAAVGTRIDNLVSIADALGLKLTELFAQIEGVSGSSASEDGESKWSGVKQRVDGLTATEREWLAGVVDEVLQSPWKG